VLRLILSVVMAMSSLPTAKTFFFHGRIGRSFSRS